MRIGLRCRWGGVWLLAGGALFAQQAPIPRADELSGQPYSIRHKWVIGGPGDGDYLTLDPKASRLFVAHGPTVQVVDIESGTVAGTIGGFHQAHAVVLDEQGTYGYATDGAPNPIVVREPSPQGRPMEFIYSGGVKVFDRRSFRVVASILTTASLRALALEPQTGLLFALGTDLSTLPPPPEPAHHRRPGPPPVRPPPSAPPCGMSSSEAPIPESVIAVFDPEKRVEIADIRVCGVLGSAVPDGVGGVYLTFTSMNMAARLDAAGLLDLLPDRDRIVPNNVAVGGREYTYNQVPELDWRMQTRRGAGYVEGIPQLRTISLGDCREPHGVAVDSRRNRLFVGCNNMKLAILDSVSGASIGSFTVGPGTDSIAYDASRSLIFSANGGGYGSVTIIRQHVTDDYSVVQNLPTMERARTMALDPVTGLLYLVTAISGANIANPPRAGIPGRVMYGPLDGSFQVLVVGN
jgi:DNA-binding beta-propeller fold protein YncE